MSLTISRIYAKSIDMGKVVGLEALCQNGLRTHTGISLWVQVCPDSRIMLSGQQIGL